MAKARSIRASLMIEEVRAIESMTHLWIGLLARTEYSTRLVIDTGTLYETVDIGTCTNTVL